MNGARSEDFVRHYTAKHDGRLPIWVGTEVMDFGLVAKVAVTAHLVATIDPQTDWKARLIDLMAGFPQNPQVSPETDMGFPVGWQSLPLWSTETAAQPPTLLT